MSSLVLSKTLVPSPKANVPLMNTPFYSLLGTELGLGSLARLFQPRRDFTALVCKNIWLFSTSLLVKLFEDYHTGHPRFPEHLNKFLGFLIFQSYSSLALHRVFGLESNFVKVVIQAKKTRSYGRLKRENVKKIKC